MAALDTAHAARLRVEIAAGYGQALCARGAGLACYGLIVFFELAYVRRTSRGTSPVVGPHLGGGPVCYNVLLHWPCCSRIPRIPGAAFRILDDQCVFSDKSLPGVKT